MKIELNTDLISNISNAYVSVFLRSLKETPGIKDYTFLNALLGFVYATKKILNSMQVLGILTSEQVETIDKQLSLAATQDVPKDLILKVIKDKIFEEEHKAI